ncbi:MAG: thiamine biosynthesis lipoprotein [Cryomorphaceae bacterium]|jgi:thiamine biosynthesis lipoprotein
MIRRNDNQFNVKAAAKSLAAFSLIILSFSALSHCNSKQSEETRENKVESSAAAELKKYSFSQPHLGTTVHIVFYSTDEKQAIQLSQNCFQRVRDLNDVFSDYSDDSELSKLCQKPTSHPYKVSEELFTVIAQAQSISAKTIGAFDITLGKHTKRWRDREAQQLEPQDEVNYQHLKLDPKEKTITLLKPLEIDLGGIAKGYIADQLMHILKESSITQAGVIIGGETVLADAPPGKDGWKIGIESPERKIIGTLTLTNTALSTSGDSYQFFEQDGERKSHLINPTTKKSKINRLNVTTIAPTAMQADAWATALRILPKEKSITLANQQPKLQALFIPYQQETIKTKGFPVITEP